MRGMRSSIQCFASEFSRSQGGKEGRGIRTWKTQRASRSEYAEALAGGTLIWLPAPPYRLMIEYQGFGALLPGPVTNVQKPSHSAWVGGAASFVTMDLA